MHGCSSGLQPNLEGEGINQKKKNMVTTSCSSSFRKIQHCNCRSSHLGLEASFVQNQRLPYKLVFLCNWQWWKLQNLCIWPYLKWLGMEWHSPQGRRRWSGRLVPRRRRHPASSRTCRRSSLWSSGCRKCRTGPGRSPSKAWSGRNWRQALCKPVGNEDIVLI